MLSNAEDAKSAISLSVESTPLGPVCFDTPAHHCIEIVLLG
jgi:hypothetical protein